MIRATLIILLLVQLIMPFTAQAAPHRQIHTLKITALVTNVAGNPHEGDGEWGYSALVEVDGHKILYDTGASPDLVLKNAAVLKIDLHDVEDVVLPFPPWVVGLFETVWTVLSTLMPVDPAQEAELQPLTRHLREWGRAVDGSAFALAAIGLQVIARQVIVATAPYDVLLSPTLAQPPLPVGGIRDLADPAHDFEDNKRFTPFTALFNLTGQPAVSLPLGWTEEGLPVGVMLAGRPAGDAALLSVAAQVEAAAPWHLRRPTCW